MLRDAGYLLDILEAARVASGYILGKTKEEFLRDSQCQDAVIRRLEIIGEAARRVSEPTRQRISQIPWVAMIRMRNLMIHEYDDVDLQVVWDTVQEHLPHLIKTLEPLVPPSEG